MVLYFTGTGNSRHIAERIAHALNDTLISLNDRIKSGDITPLAVNGRLVLVMPTYAWRIPRIVRDHLLRTELRGARETWFVMDCGSEIGNAAKYNRALCREKGLVYMGTAQIVMPENYIAMFDALGQVDRIIGVSGIDYVSNPYILAHKDSIKDMGPEMNYELLLGLKPDVVLLYGIGDAQTAVTDKLKELFIPYMYVGEYLEESPLGKAEWMVALSELTDSREKGIEIFSEIPKRYQTLKDLTASVEQRPTVMFNTPWNDSWIMPSTKSYMAQLVNDAGADYIYKENTSNSSAPIGLETAYGLIQKADYWINVGMASTLDELKAVNPKFTDAKSVREKTAYNNNLRLTATGGNEYWESAVVRPDIVLRDLIHIFHPELVSDSLYYYRHLE